MNWLTHTGLWISLAWIALIAIGLTLSYRSSNRRDSTPGTPTSWDLLADDDSRAPHIPDATHGTNATARTPQTSLRVVAAPDHLAYIEQPSQREREAHRQARDERRTRTRLYPVGDVVALPPRPFSNNGGGPIGPRPAA